MTVNAINCYLSCTLVSNFTLNSTTSGLNNGEHYHILKLLSKSAAKPDIQIGEGPGWGYGSLLTLHYLLPPQKNGGSCTACAYTY